MPHITILRPVKGLEPSLYECIASTFRQDYRKEKLTIRLCVAEASDPAYPLLQKLVADFPGFDAQVLLESEDPLLSGADGHVNNLGANRKVRNISRGYREAKGDIIWMVDCNVWVGKGVAGRMVDKLLGLTSENKPATPYKFVHQLPLLVDTVDFQSKGVSEETQALLGSQEQPQMRPTSQEPPTALSHGGGRLDEMFMSTTHAKFYCAFSTVGAAPCVVGKSNMFRKSHLDTVTDPDQNPNVPREKNRPVGIDYFSYYICEDHLIGDMLWKWHSPGFKKHALMLGDLVIQPTNGMSVKAYIGRRVRWLRARKWAVLLATRIEPGIESLLWSVYFTFAVMVLARVNGFNIPWSAIPLVWLTPILIWIMVDWTMYQRFQAGLTVEKDEHTPRFATGEIGSQRKLGEWLVAWLGREFLALPIWSWAFYLPTVVSWRGQKFQVARDMSVVEIESGGKAAESHQMGPRSQGKDRLD